jgi:AcrR family transcriptional regulator
MTVRLANRLTHLVAGQEREEPGMLAPDKNSNSLDVAEIVDEVILSRRSVRAFLPDPVDDETVREILALGARAPSGTNMQPWKAYVMRGDVKERISRAILESGIRAEKIEWDEYRYYPDKFFEPYLGRRRAFDRDLALRRAMEVFWAKGYDKASLTDLTSAMGINSPSLYAAFGSKEALFEEAVTLYGEVEGTDIWKSIAEGPTARESISGFLHSTAVAFTQPGKPAGCLIVLGALHSSDTSESACSVLRGIRAQNVEMLRDRLDRAAAEGELPAGLDTQAIAVFFVTIQQGMSIQARDGASRETLQAIAEGAMAAWDRLTAHSAA